MIITEFSQRVSRPPEYERESRTAAALLEKMAAVPAGLLQSVAECGLTLCDAHSAGISIREEENGIEVVRWFATAGQWSNWRGITIPLEMAPCAATLRGGDAALLSHPERNHPFLEKIAPAASEMLLVPFYVAGKPAGCVWVAAHDESRKFDGEDQRLLSGLGRFAAAALPFALSGSITQESDRYFREMIDVLPAAIYTTNPEGRLTHFNQAAVALSGRVPDPDTDRWCITWRRYRPDGTPLPHDECPMAVALKEGRAVTGEEIIVERPDGKRVWIEPYPTPLWNSEGRIIGGVNLLLDISRRKEAEQAVRSSEAALRDFVENASIGIYSVGADGIILWANPAELELLGYTAGEYIGHHISEFHADPLVVQDMLVRLAGLERLHEFEARLRHKNGTIRHVVINSNAFFENGHFIHTRCFTRDVTERRQVEEAQARLAAIVDSSDDAIIGKTLDGIITSWNRSAERIFGYTAQEAIGRHISLIVPEERVQEVDKVLGSIRRGERVDHFETVRQTKDGRRLQISLTVSPIRDARGHIIGASKVARDITNHKVAEEEFRQTQKLESIGLLAGGIAHDFNNLLTGILGNASLALDMMPDNFPARKLLDEVMRASDRAAALTRQMLAYAGKGQFLIEPLNLSDLVKDIAGLVQATIPKTVQLRLMLEDPLPPIDADGSQLQQLIMNLVINGAEAIGESKTGAVEVTTTVVEIDAAAPSPGLRQGEWRPGRFVSLDVRDNGCGMDEKTQARIFDPFFTTKFTGRGLGLAAALGIVRSHRGMIRVSSTPGAGSVFEVLFPISKGAALPQATETRREMIRLSGETTVLVVDDEDIVRRTAKQTLQRCGCAVLTAENGLDAVELFQVLQDRISLVLLDLTMPVMAGEEALRRLRRLRPDLPVILSSGYNHQDVIRRFEGSRISAFLQKPYTASQLAATVKGALAKKLDL